MPSKNKEKKVEDPKLYDINCTGCKEYLASTVKGGSAFCGKCKQYTAVEIEQDKNKKNTAK